MGQTFELFLDEIRFAGAECLEIVRLSHNIVNLATDNSGVVARKSRGTSFNGKYAAVPRWPKRTSSTNLGRIYGFDCRRECSISVGLVVESVKM